MKYFWKLPASNEMRYWTLWSMNALPYTFLSTLRLAHLWIYKVRTNTTDIEGYGSTDAHILKTGGRAQIWIELEFYVNLKNYSSTSCTAQHKFIWIQMFELIKCFLILIQLILKSILPIILRTVLMPKCTLRYLRYLRYLRHT